ncbi:MAG: SusC/RagA family TonB-linked outer membrane protein [Candidatus Cyclobacteriaceae bacterium M3_2C_046]
MTKMIFYSILLQSFFVSMLLANDGKAQQKSIYEINISISKESVKLGDLLNEIERKTDFRFSYNNTKVNLKELISIKAANKNLASVLEDISKLTNLKFKRINQNIHVSPKQGSENTIEEVNINPAQSRKITGRITSFEDNEPLPGVNIVQKGTTNGTITDINGEYTLTVPEGSTIVFSSVGYTTEEIQVNNQSVIDLVMTSDIKQLQELVVIGYGSREKKDVTTSISTVDSKEITKSVSMSPEFAMQGRMTGVHVSGNTGNPMDRPTVRIRGTNTWGVADPLYVIDGVPVTELGGGILGQENARVRDVRGPINIMSMINPNDIESISVLKDASAAAIYGVRAANGVILITTKKGNSETPTINFNARYGVQNLIRKWDVLNTQQYVEFFEQAYANNPDFNLDPQFDPSSPLYLGDTEETWDWQSPLINENATTQDYAVNISGKTEKTNYYASANYASTEGVLINENLDRYSFNIKLDNEVKDWLNIGINYRLAYIEGEDKNRYDITDRAQTPPWQPIYATSGVDELMGFAPVVTGYDEDGTWRADKLYGEGTRINSFGWMALNTQQYNSVRNLGTAFIELKPLENLSVKGTFSIDWYQHNRESFNDYMANYFSYTSGDPAKEGAPNSLGQYGERTTTNYNQVNEITVNYKKSVGDHNFDLLLNGQDQQFQAKYVGGRTRLVTTKLDYLWTMGGPDEWTNIESEPFRWALQGLLARIGYNYNYKYYLDLTVRRDGSNRFAPGKRWGTFPSASAAWRMSAEPFMQNQNFITDLKFRAGWGQLGNQEVRQMAYLSAIEKTPTYSFGSLPGSSGLGNYYIGAAMFSFPNPDLEWEKTTTTNLGFDAVLFDNLDISFEYYYKKTDGILQETTIPPSAGSKLNPVANIASIKNEGIELSLNYRNSLGELNYAVGGNITTVHNEVITTDQDIPFNTGNGRIEPGYSVNYIYGYRIGGLFQNQDQVDQYTSQTEDKTISRPFAPGDLYFMDVNGEADPENGYRFYTPGADGVINEYDRTFLGNTIPGYYYGFNLGLDYKGFDFSAFFQGVGDVMKINSSMQDLGNLGTRGNNRHVSVLNSWTEENPSNTIPKAIVAAQNHNSAMPRFVESAAYLRLNNVQLGYTLPQTLYDRLNNSIEYARIYMSVNNAFFMSPWSGLDPENDNNPMPRVFNLGINARF